MSRSSSVPRLSRWAACSALLVPLQTADPAEDLAPTPEQGRESTVLAVQLQRAHYRQIELDDALSEHVLDRYLGFLDPGRVYLLASDVAAFEGWRDELDDALRRGDLEPAFAIFNRVQDRRVARLEALIDVLAGDGPLPEPPPGATLDLDRSDAPWPGNAAEADRLWRARLAGDVIDLRLADRTPEEARDLLERRYRNLLRQVRQTRAGDVFQIFMNALTSSYDPHSRYLAPRIAEDFDMQMSLSLEGIGALLRSDGEMVRVERLIPGGPAEAQGELEAGDRIVGVGQGETGEIVDVVGWRIDEVVDLIRGPRDSVVRLRVLPAEAVDGAATHTIAIRRDEVRLEEQAAATEIVEVEDDGETRRLGVIDLPAFYMDFQGRASGETDYKSTTRDVERLLRELEAEDVDGVVLDLRGNGGGSLVEAHELAGLFLGRRPVVQVRDAEGSIQVLAARRRAVWTGPLVVLVDRLSASASEIVAAAVQDYGRGVVCGETTFGKGTVQSVVPAGEGRLLVTMAKFYRVDGRTTQHAGVTPDVVFPETHDRSEIGESALDDALPADRIRGLRIERDDALGALLPALRRSHAERARTDPDLVRLGRRLEVLARARARTELSLDLETRRAERAEREAQLAEIDAAWRAARGLPDPAAAEAAEAEPETAPDDSAAEATDTPDPSEVDALRAEAVRVLVDLVRATARSPLEVR